MTGPYTVTLLEVIDTVSMAADFVLLGLLLARGGRMDIVTIGGWMNLTSSVVTILL